MTNRKDSNKNQIVTIINFALNNEAFLRKWYNIVKYEKKKRKPEQKG